MAQNQSLLLLTPSNTHRQVIDQIVPRLTAVGVPVANFDESNLCSHGYTNKFVARLLSPFYDKHNSAVDIQKILRIGITNHFFESVDCAPFQAWMSFLKYLKTPQGKEQLHQVQFERRLQKLGGDDYTVEEVALLQMFEAMRNDYLSQKHKLVKHHDAIIKRIRCQLVLAQKSKQTALNDLATAFAPNGHFPRIPLQDRNAQCWSAYLEKCNTQGFQPVSISSFMIKEANRSFGDNVQKRRILDDVLQSSGSKEIVYKYMDNEIVRMEACWDVRQAKRYRNLLASVSRDKAAEEEK